MQTGRFGRSRVLTRFLALDPADRLLIDRLVDRAELRVEPEPVELPQESFGDLRGQLLAEPRTGRVSRFLRRR